MLIKPDTVLLNASRQELGLPLLNEQQFAQMTRVECMALFEETRLAAINWINVHNGQLPTVPFPETHPYKSDAPLTYAFHKYIVGTTAPISYLLNDSGIARGIINLFPPGQAAISEPAVPTYHGNQLRLWRFNERLNHLLSQNFDRGFKRQLILDFLSNSSVNYVDVIDGWQRGQYNASDSELRNVVVNEEAVDQILMQAQNGQIPSLIFNTSSTFGSNGLQFPFGTYCPGNKSFDIFLWMLQERAHTVMFSLDDNEWVAFAPANADYFRDVMINKVIFYLKIDGYKVLAITGPSPVLMGLDNNLVYQRYCEDYQMDPVNARIPFLRFVYSNWLAENYEPLWTLNGG